MFRAKENLTHLVECFSGIFLEVQQLKKMENWETPKKFLLWVRANFTSTIYLKKKGIVSK